MLLLSGCLRQVGERSRALQPARGYRRRVHAGTLHSRQRRDALSERPPQARASDPPAVAIPATAFLSVPQCSAAVPVKIDLIEGEAADVQAQQARAQIARRLFAMGVLREVDWTGEVNSSVDFGLLRWACEEHGGHTLSIADFDLVYTENVAGFDFGRPQPYGGSRFHEHEPVGGFALRATGYSPIFVERAVRQWEEIVPGLGFALYDLAQSALASTVRVAGVDWVVDQLEGEDWEPEEAEEAGYLTLDKFMKSLPSELFKVNWHPEYAQKALRKRKPRLTDTQAQVMAEALELSEAITTFRLSKAYHDDLRYFDDTQQVLSIGARWNNADDMARVIDDYHDHLMEGDWQTEICYIQCFQLGIAKEREGSLENAITSVGATIDLLVRAERLLRVLNGDPTPLPKTPRKRKGRPLVQIFAEDMARNQVEVEERVRIRV